MRHEQFSANGASFGVTHLRSGDETPTHIFWGHGWGQSGAALLPLAESIQAFANSSVIDFAGFGGTPTPPDAWGTAEYADAVASWMPTVSAGQRGNVWIGHSFGARVGLQLAARHPQLVSGLVIIAGAGLRRQLSPLEKLKRQCRTRLFKAAKAVLPEGPALDRLRALAGSSDYASAGAMRPILVRVVQEDLSDVAARISCPVLLLYGALDKDTPPELGIRFRDLIRKSELLILDGLDHHSILTNGRHQVVFHVRKFLSGLA